MPSKSKSKPKPPEHQNVENPSKISSLKSNLPESSGSLPGLRCPTTFNVRRSSEHSAFCRWVISNFPEARTKNRLLGPYTQVGNLCFRLGMVAGGLCGYTPGYLSFFIELDKARCLKSDCVAGFKVTLVNHLDDSQSMHMESHYRYVGEENFTDWKDFAVLSTVLDPKSGFLLNQSVCVTARVCDLDETLTFSVDDRADGVYVGKYSWRIRNFSLFKEMIETQRITSPAFRIGLCDYRLTIDKCLIKGVEHLSLYLKSDIEFGKAIERRWIDATKTEPDKSCWGFYEIWVLNQKRWLEHMHRKSTGRFSTWSCDKEHCGWLNYMKMSDFIGSRKGFLWDDGTVVFCVSFQVVKESFYSKRSPGNPPLCAFSKYDKDIPTFYWEIRIFTFLKDIMMKTMTGIRIESMVMQVQKQSFLLAAYPRGRSHKLSDLALVLESINSTSNSPDWSGLVHYRFGIMNHKASDKPFIKESLRRCCRDTKEVDSEFIMLTGFFDENCGYISKDTAVFFSQIDILKETLTVKNLRYTWKVENFLEFKEILAYQEVHSKFFRVPGYQFRFRVFISFNSLRIYLDYDPSLASDADDIFRISFCFALWNQKYPTKSLWKNSALLTKTRESNGYISMKLSDILEPDSGYVVHNMIVFVCQILDYSPRLDILEPEVLACDEDKVRSSSDSGKPLKSKDTELNVKRKVDTINKPLKSKDIELNVERKVDIFTNLISGAVCRLMHENNHPRPIVILRAEFQLDVYVLPFAPISQSGFGNKFWEHVFSQNLAHLLASNDETPGIIICLMFRTASQSQHIPQAVKIHVGLEELGTAVPTCALNLVSETITIWDGIAEAMLREIYSVFSLYDLRKRMLQLTACQQQVHYVDVNIQEEISRRNAPLYCIGLEDVSMEDLETIKNP